MKNAETNTRQRMICLGYFTAAGTMLARVRIPAAGGVRDRDHTFHGSRKHALEPSRRRFLLDKRRCRTARDIAARDAETSLPEMQKIRLVKPASRRERSRRSNLRLHLLPLCRRLRGF